MKFSRLLSVIMFFFLCTGFVLADDADQQSSITLKGRQNTKTVALPLLVAMNDKGQIVNLALGKPASQSSVYTGTGVDQGAHFGNDGILESRPRDPYLMVHTNADSPPWWQVDLQNVYELTEVKIYNRVACCQEKMKTVQVMISNDGRSWTTAYSHDGRSFEVLTVDLKGRRARYVRLQLRESVYLHFQECEVYGYSSPVGAASKGNDSASSSRGTKDSDKKSFCDNYSQSAIAQNKENAQKKCAYSGGRWLDDYNAHYDWCMKADKSIADSETRARTDQLSQCSTKAAASKKQDTAQQTPTAKTTSGHWRLKNASVDNSFNKGGDIVCTEGSCVSTTSFHGGKPSSLKISHTWTKPPVDLQPDTVIPMTFKLTVLENVNPSFNWCGSIDARVMGQGWAMMETKKFGNSGMFVCALDKTAPVSHSNTINKSYFPGKKGDAMVYEIHIKKGNELVVYRYNYEWVQ